MPSAHAQERYTEIRPPHITQEDFFAFHETHFSGSATVHFKETFVNPTGDETIDEGVAPDDWDEEEDDLGYYHDGVKRTLTDEQIAIFRHSELEALRREQEKASRSNNKRHAAETDGHDTYADTILSQAKEDVSSSDGAKRKKKKGSKRPRPEPKPDLRKRTWDVVEAGLDTLDYD